MSYTPAPKFPLPGRSDDADTPTASSSLVTIEYPGYLPAWCRPKTDPLESSASNQADDEKSQRVERAIETLGGRSKITSRLNDHLRFLERSKSKSRTAPNASLISKPIELSLREGDPFAHPVQGDFADVRNIVLKVTRRRKRRRKGREGNGGDEAEAGEGGIFKVEVEGVVQRAIRFRCEC